MVYSLSRWHKTLEQNQLFLQWEILKLCGCLSIGCKWNALAKPVGSSWAINHGLCNQISFHSFNYFSFLLDRIQIFDFFPVRILVRFRLLPYSVVIIIHRLLSRITMMSGSATFIHYTASSQFVTVHSRKQPCQHLCLKLWENRGYQPQFGKKKSSTDSAVAFDHLHGFSYVYTIYDIHGFLYLKNYLSLKVRSHMRYTFWKIGHFLLEAYILGAENKIDNQ